VFLIQGLYSVATFSVIIEDKFVTRLQNLLKQLISLIEGEREEIHAKFVNKYKGNIPLGIHLVWVDMTLLTVKVNKTLFKPYMLIVGVG
jgi:hypothetical protein